MNIKLRIGIGILVLILVASGAVLYTRRVSGSNDLSSLNTVDATAYRYTLIAQYYARQSATANMPGASSSASSSAQSGQVLSGFPDSGVDLTTLSPVDATAYRYTLMAYYYAAHPNATR